MARIAQPKSARFPGPTPYELTTEIFLTPVLFMTPIIALVPREQVVSRENSPLPPRETMTASYP